MTSHDTTSMKGLKEFMGHMIPIDLDHEVDEDFIGDPSYSELDPQLEWLRQVAKLCIEEIENTLFDNGYEQIRWSDEFKGHRLCLIPIEIHMVYSTSADYPRFWGYLCEMFPESESINVRKVTLSLPTAISRPLGATEDSFVWMKADPLEDSVVTMIITTYLGLQSFIVNGHERKIHRFQDTFLIAGYRSADILDPLF